MPTVLYIVAIVSLVLAVVGAAVVAIDIACGHRQAMWIMDLVWPITALYAGPLGVWAYFAAGRQAGPRRERPRASQGDDTVRGPSWRSTALATSHCGAGCTLGDLVAEGILPVLPFVLFGQSLFFGWTLDYILALLFGIAFQYFTLKPMGRITAGQALVAAFKADVLSMSAWQIGMYGWMALATLVIFRQELSGPVFWFMMQVAMLAGFATSFPVNAWLLRAGIKEPM